MNINEDFLNKKATNNFYPWLNYPTIDFLQTFLTKESDVFEYGAGNSTLFFATIVRQIFSIESTAKWHDFVVESAKMHNLKNINITLCDNLQQFPDAISTFNTTFDLILIDSRERARCLEMAPDFLKPNGVILLDNSERENLQEQIAVTINSGFTAKHLYGIGPNREYPSSAIAFCRK